MELREFAECILRSESLDEKLRARRDRGRTSNRVRCGGQNGPHVRRNFDSRLDELLLRCQSRVHSKSQRSEQSRITSWRTMNYRP